MSIFKINFLISSKELISYINSFLPALITIICSNTICLASILNVFVCYICSKFFISINVIFEFQNTCGGYGTHQPL